MPADMRHQRIRLKGLRAAWRSKGPLACALLPLAMVYAALTTLRRKCYEWGVKKTQHAGVPVIVIGNVIAGGAGKTPVTLATVNHLQRRGHKVGILSRGYGRTTDDCRQAHPQSSAQEVGDEPLLIARASGAPVFVAKQRIDAAHALLKAYPETTVLVCDDGLQHYALARDIEICVFNDEGVGNGWLLPAGPLREAWPRSVSAVLYCAAQPPAGTSAQQACFQLQRQLASYAVRSNGERVPLQSLQATPLHAVAAIARPEDFFAMLRAQSLELLSTEGLPDHFNYQNWQPPTNDGVQVVCTEKDAAKIWQRMPQALAIPLQLNVDQGYFDLLDTQLHLSLSLTKLSTD